MKVKNPVSQNIRIFPKINQKKDLPTEKFKFFKVCSFMHSILGRGSFSTEIPASVRSGMEAINLWHCWGTIEPSARLYCWIDCFSSFSWKYPIDSIWGSSSIVISWSANHFEVILGWRHKVLQNLLVDGCIDFGLDKTQWTNTSRRHGTPNHHWLQKLHTGLQAAWMLCLSSLPPDSRPWFPNEMQMILLLSEKRTLDHWATVQFFFSTAQVRCFWLYFCFRSGLVALFLKMSERGDSWCTDSSFSPLLVKLSQVFELGMQRYHFFRSDPIRSRKFWVSPIPIRS